MVSGGEAARLADLRKAATSGALYDLSSAEQRENLPHEGHKWGEARTISANALSKLVTTDRQARFAPKRVYLKGARITGDFDLEGATVTCPVLFVNCYFDKRLLVREAQTLGLRLAGCFLSAGIDGRGIHVAGDLELEKSYCQGYADLKGARVDGGISFVASRFFRPGAEALMLDGSVIGGDVFCSNGFRCWGEVRMLGAEVSGQVNFAGATIENPGKDALSLDATTMGESLYCSDGFLAKGTVRLPGAQISGQLGCEGGKFDNPGGVAFMADRAKVAGGIRFTNDFRVRGRLGLPATRVGAQIRIGEGVMENPGDYALSLDNCEAAGTVLLDRGLRVTGAIRMLGARLGSLLIQDASIESTGTALWADRLTVDEMELGPNLRIAGVVALRGAEISGRMGVMQSWFEAPGGDALIMNGATVRGDLMFAAFTIEGGVRLHGASIRGSVTFTGGRIEAPGGMALVADGVSIRGTLLLGDELTVAGTVRMLGAEIGGQLNCRSATFIQRRGQALIVDRSSFTGGAFFNEGFRALGEVRLSGVRLGGQLNCIGARMENPGGTALSLESSTLRAEVYLNKGFRAAGMVQFSGATVTGLVDCGGGEFSNRGKIALLADRASFGNEVRLNEGFRAEGLVRMVGVKVAGPLFCNAATFAEPKMALALEGSLIEEDLVFGEDFVAEGEVGLTGVEVRGVLNGDGSKFRNPRSRAITGDRLRIGGNIRCGDGFLAEGEVRLLGCDVAGQLIARGGVFVNPGGTAIDLAGGRIGELYLEPGEAIRGRVDLRNAEVGLLYDDPRAWADGYALQGLRYDRLRGGAPKSAAEKIGWLEGSLGGYQPEIYDQLARTFERAGRDDLQREVLVAKERRRRPHLTAAGRLWSRTQDVLVGFGYRTWQAIAPFLLLLAFGTVFFGARYEAGDLTERIQDQAPPFKPLTYTLDLLVPVVDLGQRTTWTAHHAAQTVSTAMVLIGWIVTTAIVAALAAALARPMD